MKFEPVNFVKIRNDGRWHFCDDTLPEVGVTVICRFASIGAKDMLLAGEYEVFFKGDGAWDFSRIINIVPGLATVYVKMWRKAEPYELYKTVPFKTSLTEQEIAAALNMLELGSGRVVKEITIDRIEVTGVNDLAPRYTRKINIVFEPMPTQERFV